MSCVLSPRGISFALGASKEGLYFSARLLAMGKPCYNAICSSAALGKQKAIVFVPSRKQAQFTAIDMLTYAAADGDAQRLEGAPH